MNNGNDLFIFLAEIRREKRAENRVCFEATIKKTNKICFSITSVSQKHFGFPLHFLSTKPVKKEIRV